MSGESYMVAVQEVAYVLQGMCSSRKPIMDVLLLILLDDSAADKRREQAR